ncbi:transcriptional regulator [Treponema parvum]|uniref:Transcriptional regulator n=1 Tax=Treponema parvum TaxID=138851 RepID=A0A975IEV1_9SPIR|nr:Trp family transcriptional regulator [Treponema parvum]QTQ14341.1 transcriptional regulator [Treponema parvum]
MKEGAFSDKKQIEDGADELCSLLAECSEPQFIKDFLICLCTPAEIKDLTSRWLLVKEINKGATQREIAKKFGMSLCKITRGSRELRKPGSTFLKMIDLLDSRKSRKP